MDATAIQWILVGLAVARAVGSIVRKLIRRLKHPGHCGCGSEGCTCDSRKTPGGCAGCPMAQTCGQVKK